jgi:hypothetical protein
MTTRETLMSAVRAHPDDLLTAAHSVGYPSYEQFEAACQPHGIRPLQVASAILVEQGELDRRRRRFDSIPNTRWPVQPAKPSDTPAREVSPAEQSDASVVRTAKVRLPVEEAWRLHCGDIEPAADAAGFAVRSDRITVKHIDDENDAEVRRGMIERYKHGEETAGAAAYIRDAFGKRLDHDESFGTFGLRGENHRPHVET